LFAEARQKVADMSQSTARKPPNSKALAGPSGMLAVEGAVAIATAEQGLHDRYADHRPRHARGLEPRSEASHHGRHD
jgi:4-aminobutyrate aminotransferase-like enzyme